MKRKIVEPPWEKLKHSYMTDPEFSLTMDAFIEMRERIKKPMTDYAVYLLIRDLEGLYGEDIIKAIRALEVSITRSWQSTYGHDKPLIEGIGIPTQPRQRFIKE
jgi:hypothetical protein